MYRVLRMVLQYSYARGTRKESSLRLVWKCWKEDNGILLIMEHGVNGVNSVLWKEIMEKMDIMLL
jgi:hypothetical protein